MEKLKSCVICNKEFTLVINGRGIQTPFCSDVCRKIQGINLLKKRRANMPQCSVAECSSLSRNKVSQLCEVHYYRLRRTGTTETRPKVVKSTQSAGYIILNDTAHPLADKTRRVYEHRAVLYDKHEGKCPSCFWCSVKLSWNTAVADHLNELKYDNRPENLVCSCSPCNRSRGNVLSFLKRISNEKFEIFAELAAAYRSSLPKVS